MRTRTAKEVFLTNQLFSFLQTPLKSHFIDLTEMGFSVYVLSIRRGYCDSRVKEIVIPEFAILRETNNKELGYLQWYVAHEFAHAFNAAAGTCDIHGPNFMEFLKKICPPEYIHYEFHYKPRNAARCGIQISADIL